MGRSVWPPSTGGTLLSPAFPAMQDCNLVVYNSSGAVRTVHTALFQSRTSDVPARPCTLTISGALDGYLAIYDAAGGLQWARPGGVQAPATRAPGRLPDHPVLQHKFDANRTGGVGFGPPVYPHAYLWLYVLLADAFAPIRYELSTIFCLAPCRSSALHTQIGYEFECVPQAS